MKYGITELSVVPGRAEASDKSEMVTQLLFGDTFSIIESSNKFIKIKLQYDNYECWICKKQYLSIKKEEFLKISNSAYYSTTDLVQVISYKNKLLPIVQGSSLPNYKDKKFTIGNQKINFEGNISSPKKIGTKDKIVEDALMYLNAPYLWGGRSPFGIDCSGLTQIVYKVNNVVIPRDASQQAELGVGYSFLEEAEAGDIAFFDNEEGKINHVGILIDKNRIIHASGKVRIDALDHQGIFNKETNSYSHKLRIIKNFF
tara:strand:- start:904 stop:1677 length:774 start_codon:yes stop_codon:yes gene_type:complete